MALEENRVRYAGRIREKGFQNQIQSIKAKPRCFGVVQLNDREWTSELAM